MTGIAVSWDHDRYFLSDRASTRRSFSGAGCRFVLNSYLSPQKNCKISNAWKQYRISNFQFIYPRKNAGFKY